MRLRFKGKHQENEKNKILNGRKHFSIIFTKDFNLEYVKEKYLQLKNGKRDKQIKTG